MSRKLLKEISPEFADEIQSSLTADGHADLASQVETLEIIDSCRCDLPNCSSFYTAPKPDKAYPNHDNIVIDSKAGMVVLDISNEKIAHIEVLDRPDVREKLRESGF